MPTLVRANLNTHKPAWKLGCYSVFLEAGFDFCNTCDDLPLTAIEMFFEFDFTVDQALCGYFKEIPCRDSQLLSQYMNVVYNQGCELKGPKMAIALNSACTIGDSDISMGIVHACDVFGYKIGAAINSLRNMNFALFEELMPTFEFGVSDTPVAFLLKAIVNAKDLSCCDKGRIFTFLLSNDQWYRFGENCSSDNQLLLSACENAHTNLGIFKLLLSNGVYFGLYMKKSALPMLINSCTKEDEDTACEIISLLLEKRADTFAHDFNEDTPLILAARKNFVKIVTLIQRHQRNMHLSL